MFVGYFFVQFYMVFIIWQVFFKCVYVYLLGAWCNELCFVFCVQFFFYFFNVLYLVLVVVIFLIIEVLDIIFVFGMFVEVVEMGDVKVGWLLFFIVLVVIVIVYVLCIGFEVVVYQIMFELFGVVVQFVRVIFVGGVYQDECGVQGRSIKEDDFCIEFYCFFGFCIEYLYVFGFLCFWIVNNGVYY